MNFDKTITLGNMLTVASFIAAAATLAWGSPGDLIRAQARITALEVANVESSKRELRFEQDVRQDLTDIKSDQRELRAEIRSAGVRWSELPPSPFRKQR